MPLVPSGIDLASLPGPKRGVSPARYARDETAWSPSGNRFALAYTICEVSMANEIDCVLWGEMVNRRAMILGNHPGVYATCWYTPWASWLDDKTFVFKAQQYDGKRLHLPLVAVNMDDLDEMLAQLHAAGVAVMAGPESHENGKFAWIMDPDGNKIELWEPMLWDDKNKGA